MSAAQLFTDLDPARRRALRRAFTDGIPVAAPASVGVDAATAHAMETEGLLVRRTVRRGPPRARRSLELWRPSEQGIEVLGITRRLERPERPADLTPARQQALRIAHAHGIPVDSPRAVGVQRSTAEALEALELLARRTTRKGRSEWRPTDDARGLLVADEPRLLLRTGRGGDSEGPDRDRRGYVSQPSRAMLDAGEAVGDETLAGFSRAALSTANDRLEQMLQRRRQLEPAERLRLLCIDAARRRIDIDRQLRVVIRRLDAMELDVYGTPEARAEHRT